MNVYSGSRCESALLLLLLLPPFRHNRACLDPSHY